MNNAESLQNTVPLLDFGFSHPELLALSGFVPLHVAHLQTMFDRLHNAPCDDDNVICEVDEGLVEAVGLGVVVGVTLGLLSLTCLGAFVCIRLLCTKSAKHKD